MSCPLKNIDTLSLRDSSLDEIQAVISSSFDISLFITAEYVPCKAAYLQDTQFLVIYSTTSKELIFIVDLKLLKDFKSNDLLYSLYFDPKAILHSNKSLLSMPTVSIKFTTSHFCLDYIKDTFINSHKEEDNPSVLELLRRSWSFILIRNILTLAIDSNLEQCNSLIQDCCICHSLCQPISEFITLMRGDHENLLDYQREIISKYSQIDSIPWKSFSFSSYLSIFFDLWPRFDVEEIFKKYSKGDYFMSVDDFTQFILETQPDKLSNMKKYIYALRQRMRHKLRNLRYFFNETMFPKDYDQYPEKVLLWIESIDSKVNWREGIGIQFPKWIHTYETNQMARNKEKFTMEGFYRFLLSKDYIELTNLTDPYYYKTRADQSHSKPGGDPPDNTLPLSCYYIKSVELCINDRHLEIECNQDFGVDEVYVGALRRCLLAEYRYLTLHCTHFNGQIRFFLPNGQYNHFSNPEPTASMAKFKRPTCSLERLLDTIKELAFFVTKDPLILEICVHNLSQKLQNDLASAFANGLIGQIAKAPLVQSSRKRSFKENHDEKLLTSPELIRKDFENYNSLRNPPSSLTNLPSLFELQEKILLSFKMTNLDENREESYPPQDENNKAKKLKKSLEDEGAMSEKPLEIYLTTPTETKQIPEADLLSEIFNDEIKLKQTFILKQMGTWQRRFSSYTNEFAPNESVDSETEHLPKLPNPQEEMSMRLQSLNSMNIFDNNTYTQLPLSKEECESIGIFKTQQKGLPAPPLNTKMNIHSMILHLYQHQWRRYLQKEHKIKKYRFIHRMIKMRKRMARLRRSDKERNQRLCAKKSISPPLISPISQPAISKLGNSSMKLLFESIQYTCAQEDGPEVGKDKKKNLIHTKSIGIPPRNSVREESVLSIKNKKLYRSASSGPERMRKTNSICSQQPSVVKKENVALSYDNVKKSTADSLYENWQSCSQIIDSSDTSLSESLEGSTSSTSTSTVSSLDFDSSSSEFNQSSLLSKSSNSDFKYEDSEEGTSRPNSRSQQRSYRSRYRPQVRGRYHRECSRLETFKKVNMILNKHKLHSIYPEDLFETLLSPKTATSLIMFNKFRLTKVSNYIGLGDNLVCTSLAGGYHKENKFYQNQLFYSYGCQIIPELVCACCDEKIGGESASFNKGYILKSMELIKRFNRKQHTNQLLELEKCSCCFDIIEEAYQQNNLTIENKVVGERNIQNKNFYQVNMDIQGFSNTIQDSNKLISSNRIDPHLGRIKSLENIQTTNQPLAGSASEMIKRRQNQGRKLTNKRRTETDCQAAISIMIHKSQILNQKRKIESLSRLTLDLASDSALRFTIDALTSPISMNEKLQKEILISKSQKSMKLGEIIFPKIPLIQHVPFHMKLIQTVDETSNPVIASSIRNFQHTDHSLSVGYQHLILKGARENSASNDTHSHNSLMNLFGIPIFLKLEIKEYSPLHLSEMIENFSKSTIGDRSKGIQNFKRLHSLMDAMAFESIKRWFILTEGNFLLERIFPTYPRKLLLLEKFLNDRQLNEQTKPAREQKFKRSHSIQNFNRFRKCEMIKRHSIDMTERILRISTSTISTDANVLSAKHNYRKSKFKRGQLTFEIFERAIHDHLNIYFENEDYFKVDVRKLIALKRNHFDQQEKLADLHKKKVRDLYIEQTSTVKMLYNTNISPEKREDRVPTKKFTLRQLKKQTSNLKNFTLRRSKTCENIRNGQNKNNLPDTKTLGNKHNKSMNALIVNQSNEKSEMERKLLEERLNQLYEQLKEKILLIKKILGYVHATEVKRMKEFHRAEFASFCSSEHFSAVSTIGVYHTFKWKYFGETPSIKCLNRVMRRHLHFHTKEKEGEELLLRFYQLIEKQLDSFNSLRVRQQREILDIEKEFESEYEKIRDEHELDVTEMNQAQYNPFKQTLLPHLPKGDGVD